MLATDLAAGVDTVVQWLTDAGIDATANPRLAAAPGVWVGLDRIRWDTLDDSIEADLSLWLIAQDNGEHLVQLSALLGLVASIPGLIASPGEAPTQLLQLPDSTRPALRITTHLQLTTDPEG